MEEKKGMLDLITDALKNKEVKAGFIIIEVETGDDKTFKGIDLIAADLKGDNKKLAERLYNENGCDPEFIESEFLTSFLELYKGN